MARRNHRDEWVVCEQTQLRIVSDALWSAVKKRQMAVEQSLSRTTTNHLNRGHRPQYLLSGILECAHCFGPYAIMAKDERRFLAKVHADFAEKLQAGELVRDKNAKSASPLVRRRFWSNVPSGRFCRCGWLRRPERTETCKFAASSLPCIDNFRLR
ncbi:hypothetical protein J2Y48_003407 [Mycoplana sp. BE70]|uniref:hypothetical protein n=1 Tax=Mycoplana sp. BE70 TaxID=2817775 RepID=UPI00286140E2|nr:hypothetical protein [Mycoplana sp. BE70]MDR6758109.1 hypothetical protein [Mycoplana sp. BE70]